MLRPQEKTKPSAVRQTVWYRPHATCTTCLAPKHSSTMGLGLACCFTVRVGAHPSCPYACAREGHEHTRKKRKSKGGGGLF